MQLEPSDTLKTSPRAQEDLNSFHIARQQLGQVIRVQFVRDLDRGELGSGILAEVLLFVKPLRQGLDLDECRSKCAVSR